MIKIRSTIAKVYYKTVCWFSICCSLVNFSGFNGSINPFYEPVQSVIVNFITSGDSPLFTGDGKLVVH